MQQHRERMQNVMIVQQDAQLHGIQIKGAKYFVYK